MKYKIMVTAAIILFTFSALMAQNQLSIGLVGTRFENMDNDSKLTNIKDPFGYGLILGYKINKDLTVAFTGEYFKDNMDNIAGNERDLRTHISLYLTPFSMKEIQPYISAGLVYTNRQFDYTALNTTVNDNRFDGRFGAGVDFHLISNLSLNVDAALYNDGMHIAGWSSSIGLRINTSLF
jgi:opacity protein-like surface antigen